MPVIVTCAGCRSSIQLPDNAAGRRFRCPRCQTEITVAGSPGSGPAPEMAIRAIDGASAAGANCPICQTEVGPGDQAKTCPSCRQSHHLECWSETGGCSTYGCDQAPVLDKTEGPRKLKAGWGDFKDCPMCGVRLKSAAMRCKGCGTRFHTADPLTEREVFKARRRQRELQNLQSFCWAAFGLSVCGLLGPIVLIATLVGLFPKRQELARGGPLHLFLMYSALGVSALYCLLIGLAVLARVVEG